MTADSLIVPNAWQQLDVEKWHGFILILGGTSTGKSTFGRYLLPRLLASSAPVAYLDADVGQQELGLPATLTMVVTRDAPDEGRRVAVPRLAGPHWMVFIGSNSPRGHFVPILVGLHRLQRQAEAEGVSAVVVDTSGFIEPHQGAAVLKWGQVDLLQPGHIVACQRQRELEPIIAPLRRLWADRLHELPVHDFVRSRSASERQAQRALRFQTYFEGAATIELSYRHLAVFPDRVFVPGQLVALEDQAGWAVALGLVQEVDLDRQVLTLTTPWWGQGKIAALRLGRLRVGARTYHDEKI
jgi:polynucleotide 5'-hydroxyl-kinase GRC3/NOL9